jgi:hypothetical protein
VDGDHHRRRAAPLRARHPRGRRVPKLLYLGTEHGIYVVVRRRREVGSLRQNLPDTPVHDLAVEGATS